MIYFLLGYPFFWFLLITLISVYWLYIEVNLVSSTLFLMAVLLGLSITPSGANAWLESVADIFLSNDWVCDANNPPQKAILLPGGLTRFNNRIQMTNWTKSRLEALTNFQKRSPFSEVIMPSGDVYWGRKESDHIVAKMDPDLFKDTRIVIGGGSYSTYSNFLEIATLISKKETYVVFTSNWHLYRSLAVAKKQGIDVCFYKTESNETIRKLKEYPWSFKAAVREYLAIGWYALRGRI